MRANLGDLLKKWGVTIELEDFGDLFRIYCIQEHWITMPNHAREIVALFSEIGSETGYDIPLLYDSCEEETD